MTKKKEKPDLKVIHEFAGPEPGYIATAKMLIACAMTLLEEQSRLPVKGGVFTPAFAFGRTTLMERLEKEGIVFARL